METRTAGRGEGSQFLAAGEMLFVVDKVIAPLFQGAWVMPTVLADLGRLAHTDGSAEDGRGEFVMLFAIVTGGVGEGARRLGWWWD